MNTVWHETRWKVLRENAEQLEHHLFEHACLGCYEVLPLEEKPPQGPYTEVIAYFSNSLTEQEKQSPLAELLYDRLIPEGNWAHEWKKYFKPFFLTPEIVICPSWESYSKNDAQVITLDPGMAFGTGQHDTTRFCAELICETKKKRPLESFIDVGCGSGILSLIASKIGFTTITAIDTDPLSIEATRDNFSKNPHTGPLSCRLVSENWAATPIQPADLVAANIIAEALCELKESLIALVKKGGFLILSGILPDKEALVQNAFDSLTLVDEKKSKDWHAYLYHKK